MSFVEDDVELGSKWSFKGYRLAVSFYLTGWREGCGFLGDLYIGPQTSRSIKIAIWPPDFVQLVESGDIQEIIEEEVRG